MVASVYSALVFINMWGLDFCKYLHKKLSKFNDINNDGDNSNNNNIALKEIEKKSKYKDLELEIQRMWHMKTVVIPVVVGALGTVKKVNC